MTKNDHQQNKYVFFFPSSEYSIVGGKIFKPFQSHVNHPKYVRGRRSCNSLVVCNELTWKRTSSRPQVALFHLYFISIILYHKHLAWWYIWDIAYLWLVTDYYEMKRQRFWESVSCSDFWGRYSIPFIILVLLFSSYQSWLKPGLKFHSA